MGTASNILRGFVCLKVEEVMKAGIKLAVERAGGRGAKNAQTFVAIHFQIRVENKSSTRSSSLV